MTREEIINGLKFTVEMFLFDSSTGEKYTEPRNDMDKITIDACRGAIKLLEQEPCEDAISRQAVLDKLNRLIEVEHLQGTDEMGYGRERVSAYECMIHAVESEYLYPNIQLNEDEGWTPVSERLPENDEVVLGTNSSNDLFKTFTWDDCGEVKWYADGCFDVPVIAWMPLPEPYKTESEVG